LNFGWFEGIPLFLLGLAGFVFLYSRDSVKFTFASVRPFTVVAFVLILTALIMILASSIQFFFVPKGSSIRPMGWTLFVGVIDIFTFLIVESFSIIAIIKEKPRFLSVVSAICGILPFLFTSFILQFASKIKGFELEP
jgi:hypothetical protein